MSKYNVKREISLDDVKSGVKPTVTLQGGAGLTQRPEHELVGILATGLDNTYYETENERDKRFVQVLNEVAKKNPTFAAKALIYARTKFGQRTVTHRGAVELIKFLAGTELAKKFFSKRDRKENRGGIVYRIDDMTEILACYLAKNGADAPIPNSIKKGFKDAIEHADAYALAKYQMKGKAVSLVDIVNLVHPVETKANGTVEVAKADYLKAVKGTKFEKELLDVADAKLMPDPRTETYDGKTVIISALRALVLGLLKQFDTVEDKNTQSGKEVAAQLKSGEITSEQAAVKLNEAKTENYKELIETKKIGYISLLRNIRNILKTNDTVLLDKACELLVQKDFIVKSLVWPIQIDLALEIMTLEFSGTQLQKVAKALGTAYELSIPNLQQLIPEGKTAVVFDTSGSMDGNRNICIDPRDNKKMINKKPAEKAALVAATFAKGVGGDVYLFADRAKQIVGWNPMDSINTLKQKFMSYNGVCGHGTEFGSCFNEFVALNKKYDRVILISDEQDGYGRVEREFGNYCKKFGTPYVYIINVCGYGPTSPFKSGDRVFRLFGYDQTMYDLITKIEINPTIVIDEINAIEI